MQLVKWLKAKQERCGLDETPIPSCPGYITGQPLIVFIVEFYNGRPIICRGIGFRSKNI
jgi:hypothetical protein